MNQKNKSMLQRIIFNIISMKDVLADQNLLTFIQQLNHF